jgi:hypothetical protein
MKNPLINIKAMQTGTHKAAIGAGAGAKKKSFGSATLNTVYMGFNKISLETVIKKVENEALLCH